MKEVDELMAVSPEIIALDATARERLAVNPGNTGHGHPLTLPLGNADGRYFHRRRSRDGADAWL